MTILDVRINGFRCNEETDGLGSDHFGLLMAGLTVDKSDPVWKYADRYRPAEVRSVDNVDTGESHTFRFSSGGTSFVSPMRIGQDLDDNHVFEVWLLLVEIDSGNAQSMYERWVTHLNEGYPPGRPVGSSVRGFPQWTFPTPDEFGGGNIIAVDTFSVDLAQPLEGSMPPERSIVDSFGRTRLLTAPQGADAVFKNRKRGGWLSETRSYRNDREDCRYTFEVEFRTIG